MVSLFEDARVEALALAAHPGLGALWRPFHRAGPHEARTAPGLMARLARALADPAYADPDPFVARGLALFGSDPVAWADPGLSRRLGDRLGNDLGQMRLPFSARSPVPEPAYRDDHSGLWEQEPATAAPRSDASPGEAAAAARPRACTVQDVPRLTGRAWRYPEWDHRIGRVRPAWVTVREESAPAAPPGAGPPADPRLGAALSALRPRRPTRLRRRTEGDAFDLAACIDAQAALRARRSPDPRVYERTLRRAEAAPVLLLVDASQSTADPLPGSAEPVLAAERRAAGLLAAALADLGIPFAVQAFRSAGRHDARIRPIKDWSDGPGLVAPRLAALTPGGSTRLGAAIRHAGGAIPAGPGLVLVLTDGEPADIDVHDPAYLVEDARAACLALARRGVRVFGIGIGTGRDRRFARMFPPGNAVAATGAGDLAGRLLRLAAAAQA